MNNEKILKPWGYEILLEKNKYYMVKLLYMKKKHRCSLQYHNKKVETIYILKGSLKISYGSKTNLISKIFKEGQSITLKNKVIHRMEGITNSKYLECSTPQLKDVVRISDDYNRN